MTILETFIKLRDDLKTWVTNNLNQKANISYVDEKFDSISEFDPTEIQEAIDANTAAIDTKVDKVDGKGLSTNDYTTADKDKLATVEANANFYEHPTHDSHSLGLYKVTVDESGHVSGATLAEKEDIVALGIPAQDTTYEEEIEGLSGRLDDVEDSINTTNETLSGVSQDFENYKTTNNKAVSTNASGIEANKTAIEAIQGDYLKSTDKTQLQDDINKVSEKATANASAIEILNGEGNGSVKQSIDNAFNEFAANVTNDDVVNTYKELIDYASKHGPEFTELVGKVDTINTHVGEIEVDISNYKTAVSDQFTEVDTTINNHVTNTNNPHGVTKEQVGLANVDNTSDIEKPISNAMQEALDEKANLEHAHSDLYYDKEEIEGLVTVDDIDDICGSNVIIGGGGDVNVLSYATKQWVQDGYQPKGNYLTSVPAGYATESYVNNKIATIPTPDVSGQINTHNLATDAHNDIRLLVDGLTTRLNTLADCDDTTLDQMSEVVEYIKSNQSLIEGVTTKKVNVADIIDNLTTNVSNKPLSAAQGVVLKGLIEELTSNLSNYQPKGDYLTAVPAGYATEEFVTAKIAEAELGGEEVDLSEYVTESEMQNYAQPKGDYLTSIPSEYITEKELENKGYLTEHQNLSDYATKKELPTKTSDLINDSGFLTSISVESVNGQTGAVVLDAASVGARPSTWMPSASEVGALPDTTAIPIVPDNISAFANDVGYLTEHQSLEGYATEEYVDNVASKAFYVTITGADGVYTADKTVAEITEAYESERVVYCKLDASENDFSTAGFVLLPLLNFMDGSPMFSAYLDGMTWVAMVTDTLVVAMPIPGVRFDDIPETLPNPNSLTFNGAVSGTYDGSNSVTITIPESASASDLTSHTSNKSNPHGVTAAQISAVPTSRTVNGKALSSNITLSAGDVGADASGAANTALTNAKTYTNEQIAAMVGDETVADQITTAIATKSDTSHTHDDRYYTESEVDTKISAINTVVTNITNGTTKVPKAISADTAKSATTAGSASTASSATKAIQDASGNEITSTYETKSDAIAKLTEANSYTDTKTSGMATTTVVDNKISTHNTSTSAHSDIRDLISGLTTRLNTLANSDDTTLDQMSEVVAYIKNNKSLIDGITTSKVNVADIVNNLTTNATNKPLSAAQGVAIKALIDALQSELDSHTHAIADVSGLQSALDGKAASSHGTHVSYSTTAPVMDGTAAVGTASTVARSDHKHPTDTSRASKTEFDAHAANTDIHITSTERSSWSSAASLWAAHNTNTTKHINSTERTDWNAAKTHADSAHAPSDAQPNQNAFSNVKVGSTTIAADTTTDTLELVGSNVTITPDATNDKVTIAVADGSTSAKGIVQLTNSTSSTSTTTAATPNSVKSAYDLANTAKTNAATAQSKADSAYSLAESKVDSLSDLGITATAAELNYMDGVTSNVQTQLNAKVSTSRTINGKALSSNITLSASEIGADASGTASNLISSHNTNTTAHADIRNQISQLSSDIAAINRDSIIQEVIAALQTPVFGRVDENNNIILTGELVPGTYTLKYESVDGDKTNIGTIEILDNVFTTELVWNAKSNIQLDVTSDKYGNVVSNDDYATTEPVYLQNGKKYTLSAANKGNTSCHFCYYNANGGCLGEVTGFKTSSEDGDIILVPPAGAASVRLYGYHTGGNASVFENAYTLSAVDDASYVLVETFEIGWNYGDKLSKTNGSVESTGQAAYSASNFINIDSGKTYSVNLKADTGVATKLSVIYYDANDNFVSYAADVVGIDVNGANILSYVVSPPTNATKIRLRVYDGSYANSFVKRYYITVG